MQDSESRGSTAELRWSAAGLWISIERSAVGICRVHLNGAKSGLARASDPLLVEAVAQLGAYFDGKLRRFDLPLDLCGTEFQRSVWEQLVQIPYGETRTYAQVATAIGNPTATRAVGSANGQNPVAIIVPCHRVVRTGGGLGGYGGGLDAKRVLLALEQGGTLPFTAPARISPFPGWLGSSATHNAAPDTVECRDRQ
jgi:methylated-DNA-[protein]-cysteine S-methyltransferase